MKEFEKWIRGQDTLPAFPRYGTVDEDFAARDGWRAALEWVLSYKKHIKYKDYEFDWVKTDIIDEELTKKEGK